MSPDDPHRASTLRVVITDALGRPLRKRALGRWLEAAAPARARGVLTLALVNDADMRRLNRRFAHIDHATDVLSFPSHGFPRLYLGDIVIATGTASRQAREARHSLDTELRVLALHGLLHLLGYDHASDNGQMARLERRLRRKGGLEEGLIDRASARVGRPLRAALRRPSTSSGRGEPVEPRGLSPALRPDRSRR